MLYEYEIYPADLINAKRLPTKLEWNRLQQHMEIKLYASLPNRMIWEKDKIYQIMSYAIEVNEISTNL